MAEAEAAAQLGRHLRQAVSANATSSGQTSIKAARELVSLLSRETPTASRVHALAQILEDEEQRYEDLCGDNSSSHRTGYPVGRILSLVQDEDDLLEKLGHNHLLDRAKGPALHAACLRLMRAILSVTGFQYPLTEDAVVDKLRLWALGPDDEADEDAAVGTVLAAANDARAPRTPPRPPRRPRRARRRTRSRSRRLPELTSRRSELRRTPRLASRWRSRLRTWPAPWCDGA